MNAGNLIGSRLADRSLMGTIGGMLAFNIVVMTVSASPPLRRSRSPGDLLAGLPVSPPRRRSSRA